MTGLRELTVLAATAVLAAPPTLALAQGGPGYYADHMWGGGWQGWLLGPMMMLFWLVILVGAVILIARWLGVPDRTEPRGGKASAGALDILRARFAKGEIDKAEYEERRTLIES